MLFFVCCLNEFFIFDLFSIIESLSNLNAPISPILFYSIYLYLFSILFIHFCYVVFSLSVYVLIKAWLWILFSTFQTIIRLWLIFLYFLTTGLLFCFSLLLACWFNFQEVFELIIKIFKETSHWNIFSKFIRLFLSKELIVGSRNIMKLLLSFRTLICFGVILNSIRSIGFLDLLNIGILIYS